MIVRVGPRLHERLQLQNPFIKRELAGENHEVKQPHRERVAEFFAQYANRRGREKKKPARCFCLPGAWWSFETTLDKRMGRTGQEVEFVGVERNYTILEKGFEHAPGRHVLHDAFETKSKTYRGFSRDRSKVVWCDASTLMGLERRDHRTNKASQAWVKIYRQWTHAWLDFSSPINCEVISCCKRLELCLDLYTHEVPIAVTFMVGREEPDVFRWMQCLSADPGADKVSDRAKFLEAMWVGNRYREAVPVEVWSYQSAGGVTMGVATFLMVLKPNPG